MTSDNAPLPPFSTDGISRILCIAAHPDDLEYGTSAAVAAWTDDGVEVGYLLLTAGEAGIRHLSPAEAAPLRAAEQREACAGVGVSDLTILDLGDGTLQHDLTTRRAIARHVRQFRPDAVLTPTWDLEVPWGLNHVDHRAAGLAVVDALRDADNPWIFPGLTDDGLEPWAASQLLVAGAEPTHTVPLDRDAVDRGIASLAAHEVYFEALPDHPSARETVESICGDGGEASGAEFALGVRVVPMG